MFRNTPTTKHQEFGNVYKACGGEKVINIGLKNVKCLTQKGDVQTIPFQIGDLVTRGLLAVSQLASLGAGVWFGPEPQFESFIVWDRNAFIAANGPKLPIALNNGTYHIGVHEVYHKKGSLAGVDGDITPQGGETPQNFEQNDHLMLSPGGETPT